MSHPPIRCTPCRVTYNNERYRIYQDGSVSHSLTTKDVEQLKLTCMQEVFTYESQTLDRYAPHSTEARIIRQEASRQRRNRNARKRNAAMRDLGMKRTPYGWE